MTARQYFLEHGITQDTLDTFGVTAEGIKITIPVTDETGQFLFNKYRHLDFDPTNQRTKKFSYDAGSHATIFNTQVLKDNDYVFLVEGEFDAMRLHQEGIAAVTNTSGAATFKEEWVELFKGKRVYILYDSDPSGQKGIDIVLELLPSAVPIHLPEGFKDVCEYFVKHTKKEFYALVKKETDENKLTFEDLCAVLDKWLLLPDKNVIRILLATLVSHFFSTDPLWMFFVAPPSGSKTEIISTVASLDFCHLLSDLTPQTLASGMPARDGKDPSLLLQLKDSILIMKDFTTVLNMRYDDKAMILSQFREIYDGRYSKAFGTGKVVDWKGRISFIAGVTSIIDTQSTVFQVMGERFIMYRVPQSNDEDVAKKALSNYGNEVSMRQELSLAMKKYFLSLHIPKTSEIELPEDIIDALASLASFVVKARSGLVRDQFRKELIYIPETEAPARFVKQLGTLIKALAVLEGRKKVNWSDYYMTMRVALDVVPANRMSHLVALSKQYIDAKTSTISEMTKYSHSGTEMILEDLTALELVVVNSKGSGSANLWKISHKSLDYFHKIVPKPSKELDAMFPDDSHYRPLINKMLDKPLAEGEEKIIELALL